jgi:hypothetical protein
LSFSAFKRQHGVQKIANRPWPLRNAERNGWRHAAQLLLDQADVAAVSRQVHLALFYDAQLDIRAMNTPG